VVLLLEAAPWRTILAVVAKDPETSVRRGTTITEVGATLTNRDPAISEEPRLGILQVTLV
jgi:hypothetical protein